MAEKIGSIDPKDITKRLHAALLAIEPFLTDADVYLRSEIANLTGILAHRLEQRSTKSYDWELREPWNPGSGKRTER